MLTEAQTLAARLTAIRPAVTIDVHSLTADGRSWILHARRFWPSDKEAFETVWATHPPTRPMGVIYGKPVTFHRYQQAYGFDYRFTGQTAAALPLAAVPAPIVPVIDALRRVESDIEPQNSALFNFYEGGSDYMGAHSDDERHLHSSAPILSLSWCQPQAHVRRFRLLPKDGVRDAVVPPAWRDAKLKGAVVVLGDGDLVVMGGACQRTHKHEVMKAGNRRAIHELQGRRINLTVRSFEESPAATRAASAAAVAPFAAAASPPAALAARGMAACADGSAPLSSAAARDSPGSLTPLSPAAALGPASALGAAAAPDEADEEAGWECAACTLINPPLAPLCAACEAARGAKRQRRLSHDTLGRPPRPANGPLGASLAMWRRSS